MSDPAAKTPAQGFDLGGQSNEFKAALGAVGLMVVGALGPWAKVLTLSVGGTDGDGVLVLVLAGIAAAGLLIGVTRARRRWLTAVVVCGGLGTLIAVIDIIDVESSFDEPFLDASVSVGWGLWLTLLASAALTFFAVRVRAQLGEPEPALEVAPSAEAAPADPPADPGEPTQSP